MIIGKSLTALGGGGLKPEIRVTAKAGALLNLYYKDSSIILQSYQLGESETQHTFVVNVSETAYVVDDVTNGKSVEVLVDVVAQYTVKIPYVLWLYKDGDECEDVTGGWSVSLSKNYFSFTLNDTNMQLIISGGGSQGKVETSNSIPVADYSKLYVEYKAVTSGQYATGVGLSFGIGTDKISYGENSFTSLEKTDSISLTVDSGKITIGVFGGGSAISGNRRLELTIKKIWLE